MSRSHQIKEYIRYFRKSKGRHGVHSPFVYKLSEKLHGKIPAPVNLILATSRHKKLINKIIFYLNCKHILWLTNKNGESETYIEIEEQKNNTIKLRSERFDYGRFSAYPPPDLYLIDLNEAADWLTAWQKYKPCIRPNDIVLISSVHHSKEHTEAWRSIYTDDAVKLSIDLFKIGLLFFKDEFKEKQHFLLSA